MIPGGPDVMAETVKRFEYPSTHRFGGRHLTNLWKKSFCSLDRTAQCDEPAVHMRRVASLAGGTLPTTAWRAPRPGGSVRRKAAAATPSFSVLRVSSWASKAPTSAPRYRCCCTVSALKVARACSSGPVIAGLLAVMLAVMLARRVW